MRFLLSLIGVLWVPVAQAALINNTGLDDNPAISSMWAQICTTLPFCDVGGSAPEFVATKIINIVFALLAAAAIITIIITSLKLVTAEGDTEAFAALKKTLLYTIIGLVLSLIARPMVVYVAETVVPLLVGG
jgi:hypothetical protein